MPSSIVQGIVEVILQGILEFVCYHLGCFVVLLVSFGRWKCDDLVAKTPRRKFLTAGFYNLRGNRIYLTAEATQLVGLIVVLLLVGGGVLVWCLRK